MSYGYQMLKLKKYRCIKTLYMKIRTYNDGGSLLDVAFTQGKEYYCYIEDEQRLGTLRIFQNDYGSPHGMTSADMRKYFEVME